MTSVKSRILQFQQNSPTQPANSNGGTAGTLYTVTHSNSNRPTDFLNTTKNNSKANNTAPNSQNGVHSSKTFGKGTLNGNSPSPEQGYSSSYNQHFITNHNLNSGDHQRKSSNNSNNNSNHSVQQSSRQNQQNFTDIHVNIAHRPQKNGLTLGFGTDSSAQQPPVNRANKPKPNLSKSSLSINLSSSSNSSKTMFRTTSSNGAKSSPITSAIPKPLGSASGNLSTGAVTLRRPSGSSVGSNRSSPATTPTSPSRQIYGGIGWKEKYDESEKRRNHLVSLAQKATRDYEELRRRYQEIYSENERLARKLDGATVQLDSLRKASEAVYDDYYKLKKRYESENREKSDALSRVDQYNKENRRLKRQSAALMMQINDPTSLAPAFDAVCEVDSAENDKEIQYLRGKVQELEAKVIHLDSELEKAKLAEFETQESVMLIHDQINSLSIENKKLKEQLKQKEEETSLSYSALESHKLEHEAFKASNAVTEEKLAIAESELKKIMNEKNILQRQSLVFMNDVMDNRLMDALNQIGDLQTSFQEERNRFETMVDELQNQLSDRDSRLESMEIQTAAKLRSFEEEVKSWRRKAEEAERRLEMEESSSCSDISRPSPPPPPPPPLMGLPPPPPPPPMPSSLSSSLKGAMGTLRRTGSQQPGSESPSPPNGEFLNGSNNKSVVGTGSPQIDDVVNQIKRGIKLKPTGNGTLTRKQTEPIQDKQEDSAVEELRAILSRMKKTKRLS